MLKEQINWWYLLKKTSKEVDFSDFIRTFAMSSRVSYVFCDTKICEISAMTKP